MVTAVDLSVQVWQALPHWLQYGLHLFCVQIWATAATFLATQFSHLLHYLGFSEKHHGSGHGILKVENRYLRSELQRLIAIAPLKSVQLTSYGIISQIQFRIPR
jgi:hypothetical protein